MNPKKALTDNLIPLAILLLLAGAAFAIPSETDQKLAALGFFLLGLAASSVLSVLTWKFFLASAIVDATNGVKEDLASQVSVVAESLKDSTERWTVSLTALMKQAIEHTDGIVLDSTLCSIEKSYPDLRSVLIVRRDGPDEFLPLDRRGSLQDYRETVRSNMKRSVRYTWLANGTSSVTATSKRTTEAALAASGCLETQYRIVPVDDAAWKSLPTPLETVFLLGPTFGESVAYMQLPALDKADLKWIGLPFLMWTDWIEQIHSLHQVLDEWVEPTVPPLPSE